MYSFEVTNIKIWTVCELIRYFNRKMFNSKNSKDYIVLTELKKQYK